MLVFVKSHKKIIWEIAIFSTVPIDPLDCLNENLFVELVWLMIFRIGALLDSNIENETAEFSDLVEQAVCEASQFRIPGDVGYRIKASALFLPPGRNFTRPLNLEIEQFAFSLVKPRSEPTYFIGWKNEASKAEHGAVIVSRMAPADVRPDVSKFVKIGYVSQ